MDKYRLTNVKEAEDCRVYYQIEAVRDFNLIDGTTVYAGDLGGWVTSPHCLSHEGHCWIKDEATVVDTEVLGDALLKDKAFVVSSIVKDNAILEDTVFVTDSIIKGNAHIMDSARVYNSVVTDNAKICEDGALRWGYYVMDDRNEVQKQFHTPEELPIETRFICDLDVRNEYAMACYVGGNAKITGMSTVYGSVIDGNVKISGNALVRGCRLTDTVQVLDDAFLFNCKVTNDIIFQNKDCYQSETITSANFPVNRDVQKYEFTDKVKEVDGHILHQIRTCNFLYAGKDNDIFVEKGNLGGWIESETNLSHQGRCWVFSGEIYGNAKVIEDAIVLKSTIKDNAIIANDATVSGCRVKGNARLEGGYSLNSRISDNVVVKKGDVTESMLFGDVTVQGTVEKSTLSGKILVDNSTVKYSVLDDNVIIKNNSRVVDCTIGHGSIVDNCSLYQDKIGNFAFLCNSGISDSVLKDHITLLETMVEDSTIEDSVSLTKEKIILTKLNKDVADFMNKEKEGKVLKSLNSTKSKNKSNQALVDYDMEM